LYPVNQLDIYQVPTIGGVDYHQPHVHILVTKKSLEPLLAYHVHPKYAVHWKYQAAYIFKLSSATIARAISSLAHQALATR